MNLFGGPGEGVFSSSASSPYIVNGAGWLSVDPDVVVFTVTSPNTFTRTGRLYWEADGGVYHVRPGDTQMLFTTSTVTAVDGDEDPVGTFFKNVDNPTTTQASVALVPEINGSGFAYIAFILGALGLWLYSGAGRGRQEETPAAA